MRRGTPTKNHHNSSGMSSRAFAWLVILFSTYFPEAAFQVAWRTSLACTGKALTFSVMFFLAVVTGPGIASVAVADL